MSSVIVGEQSALEKFLIELGDEAYSYSGIDTFQRCHRKHKYEYHLRLGSPAPKVAADAGTCMHAAIATLWKTNDVDKSIAMLKSQWEKLFAWVAPAGFVLAKQYHLAHLIEVFLRYGLDVHRNDQFPPISPDFVEIGFIIEIDDPDGKEPPAHIYGRMDWIGKGGPITHVAPVDTKTTSSWGQDFASKFDPNLQGDMYYFAARRLLPDEKITGFYINGILLQVTKIEFNRVFIPRADRDMDEIHRELFWWIKQIRAARASGFWPKSTNQCTAYGLCPFVRVCTSHQLEAVIDSFPRRGPASFHFSTE